MKRKRTETHAQRRERVRQMFRAGMDLKQTARIMGHVTARQTEASYKSKLN